MRLHQLEISAFGPFADTVHVDFDALSDAGLFLLSGPTGAGKSSVLDAVCFALYGDVPGDRSTAKRLRCDQAAEGTPPRVLLEVTLSGRRFRIDRSPAWVRPKRRGAGTTTEQARVVISERARVHDEFQWRPLSTRLDETGHLVTRLVGMNLTQFTQVALLPQGRFQAFLRAGSEERHDLLQQVFRTGRFDQVEGWLRARRVELGRASRAHQEEVADLLSRLSEVASSPAPAGWEDDPAQLAPWSAELLRATREQLSESVHALAHASEREEAATAAEHSGRLADEAIKTLAQARAEEARIARAETERHARAARLEASRRAEPVRQLHTALARAEQRVATAQHERASALHSVAVLAGVEVAGRAELGDLRRQAVAALTDVARVRPLASRAEEVLVQLQAAEAAQIESRSRLDAAALLAETVPALVTEQRARLTDATRAEAQLPGLRSELSNLQQRHEANARAEELCAELASAEADSSAALSELQLAKEAWLEVRERRLDGMAAEIATALVVGGCCPVCGSADHPAPASPAPGAPTIESERRARSRVDDLEAVLEARTQQVRGIGARLAASRASAGQSVRDLPQLISRAEVALTSAEGGAALAPGLSDELARLETRLRDIAAEQQRAGARLAEATTLAAGLAEEHHTLLAQIEAVLADSDCEDLDTFSARLKTVEDACLLADEALSREAQACAVLEETASTATSAATEAGFVSLAEALTAWVPSAELAEISAWLDELKRASERVAATLADETLQASARTAPPDLDALAEALGVARLATQAARRTHDALVERTQRLTGLSADLDEALTRWAPVRSDHDTVAAMSAFVEGKSPDNRLQMRLSAYVLAHRLGQVVAAANLRLCTMSDQRFSLVHTGQRGAGDRRGGLSLLVRDDWSGESRDPATLSGGETFVVSLALALGLADVITAEAGGADLDTLFVDEGFGSLDADTLDDVMDTLDSLRDGGRIVGVVSHVADMQTSIPTQLRVHKDRTGSRLSQ